MYITEVLREAEQITSDLNLPDIQSSIPNANFKLTRVGVTNVKKLVHVKRPNREEIITLVVTMDLFVDLPATQKGSHMSRNIEIAEE
ncbi:MAG: GTP cyclohydrolase I FolE2, partial [Thermoplasmata archaeon]|nr:GTP cyclohydrolase I FolE2 [Thermoplasmata archaeon]